MRVQASRDAAGLWVRARRDVTRPFAGAYRSAFRGHGLIFDELRDYVPGDDAQWIEWNATARLARPIVKQMREERDGVLALLVDLSDSAVPGHAGRSRRDAIVRAAAALAFAAARVGDPISLLCFGGERLETWLPQTGPAHLSRIFTALAGPKGGARSDLRPALAWATDRLPRRSIVVVLSDGYCADPGPVLARCARKHELIALWVEDEIDAPPATSTPVRVTLTESGLRGLWRARGASRRLALDALLLRGVEVGQLGATTLIADLRHFFARRAGLRA